MKYLLFPSLLFVLALVCSAGDGHTGQDAVIATELIFAPDSAPFASCHASSIVETPAGLVAAWFAGPYEKHPSVGIWISRQVKGKWTTPVEIADGIQDQELRYPAWNPVLFCDNSQTLLFYKIGPSPMTWWGEVKKSSDFGVSWSDASRLPDNIYGPIRSKPILLNNGELLCPSSTEDSGWNIHMEITPDLGTTWIRTPALNHEDKVPAIQPTLLVHPGEKLQLLCRTRKNRIYTSWSTDRGRNWTEPKPISLPNPNSGIDALTLKDGRHLLVYNHITTGMDQSHRNILNLAVSNDGLDWEAAVVLEDDSDIDQEKTLYIENVGLVQTDREYSYPAIIQTKDEKIHITYTWKRESIKHVIIDPGLIESRPIINDRWPDR